MMTRHALVPGPLALLLLSACSGGSSTEAPTPEATPTPATEEGPASALGGVEGQTVDGERVIFAARRPAEVRPAYDPAHLVREPSSPDPQAGDFTLDEAVEGMTTDGELVAELGTDFGTLFCDLHADRTPRTVAHFIGLVRGNRPFWDVRAGQWVTRPYYRDTVFHRVVPGSLIQGGDYLGDGTGTIGFTLPLESHETLRHDRAGQLALATLGGPNEGGAQIYLTDGPMPALDGTATIFGHCIPEEVISQIARVPQSGAPDNRPLTPFRITRTLIRRVQGGAAAARPRPPERPPGEPAVGQGASEDPSITRQRMMDLPRGTPRPPGAPPVPPRPSSPAPVTVPGVQSN